MEKIQKKSWNDVSINDWLYLASIMEDDSLQDYEKNVKLVSYAFEIDEDAVWKLDITTFRSMLSQLNWLNDFKINDNPKFNKIIINGRKYNVDVNLQHFMVGQYIDFQTLYPKMKRDPKQIKNLLACFLIPEGKTYNEGYTIDEHFLDTIGDSISIVTANEIILFFLKSYLISMRITANYFNYQIAKMKRKIKDKEKVEKLEKDWNIMKIQMLDLLKTGMIQ